MSDTKQTRSERLAEDIVNCCGRYNLNPPEIRTAIEFARRALEELREECAKVCDREADDIKCLDAKPLTDGSEIPRQCAAHIRKLKI